MSTRGDAAAGPGPARPEPVTPTLLRAWPLPGGGSGKDDRGSVLVIGGARTTPGAALLAGVAALRVPGAEGLQGLQGSLTTPGGGAEAAAKAAGDSGERASATTAAVRAILFMVSLHRSWCCRRLPVCRSGKANSRDPLLNPG